MIAEPYRWLGESVGVWIQTAILAVSAGTGIWVIKSHGDQERRRATVDLIVDQRRDAELIAARLVVKALHDREASNYARYLDSTDSEEYKAIMLTLNAYEFVASGIREKAFSEAVYKRLRCSTLIRDWESFQAFVIEFRKQKSRKTFFQDFEWLYKRWTQQPLRSDT